MLISMARTYHRERERSTPRVQEMSFLQLLAGVLAPILVGVITKASWPGSIKAAILLAVTAATSVVDQAIQAGGFGAMDWRTAVIGAVVTWVVAVAAHHGLLRPTGVADWAQRHGVRDRDDLAA